MSKTLTITLAQLNFTVGDMANNVSKMLNAASVAKEQQADMIVFPELALTGYPPEDLILRDDFHLAIHDAMNTLIDNAPDITIVLGWPQKSAEYFFNAACVIQGGQIITNYHKQCLPNYGVFDEKRYFTPGHQACVFSINDFNVALTICEDLWHPQPIKQAVEAQAELVLCLNASPFDIHKANEREKILKERIHETNLPIIYSHCVGAQDELVFDGGSMALDINGVKCAQAPFYLEELLTLKLTKTVQGVKIAEQPLPADQSIEEKAYNALVLGVRDYIKKNNFREVVLGLSGGIDSALTLAVAIDAIGVDNVEVVLLPSRYTSQLSTDLALEMIQLTGVKNHSTISIEPLFETALTSLEKRFQGTTVDITEENIQARSRGLLLMAISNKTHKLVLTTGNKSEYAVGYATLYGDMAGGLAVLKDIPKTLAFKLSKYRNSISKIIPQEIIDRPPTAELAEGQKDQDTLPPYEILDQILERFVEYDHSIERIVNAGFARKTVEKVIKLVTRSEYKRRQAAPGIRITSRIFGRERRYPITTRFPKV